MIEKQRQHFQSPAPGFLFDVEMCKKLHAALSDALNKLHSAMSAAYHRLKDPQHQLQLQQLQQQMQYARSMNQQPIEGSASTIPPPSQTPLTNNAPIPPSAPPPRPPTAQPEGPPLSVPHVPQNIQTNNRMPTLARPPSAQKPSAPISESAHSPPVSTPGPSAPTSSHLHSSPSTLKSPKAKAPPKKGGRRPSKAIAPTTPITPNPSSEMQAPSPAQAGPSSHPTPVPSASTLAAPSPPGTDNKAPSTSSHPTPTDQSHKRQREEEEVPTMPISQPVREETPTKRARTEPGETLDTILAKRQEEMDNIKTTEDASQFYQNIMELLQLSNNSELPAGIQETLSTVVQSFVPGSELQDVTSSLAETSRSVAAPTEDDVVFSSFVDFSSWDTGKTNTPDLVPASSTNPSPESGSDAEHPVLAETIHDPATVVDFPESDKGLLGASFDLPADPLRLGSLGEIDGGESSYFNGFDFKWDSGTPGDWAFT